MKKALALLLCFVMLLSVLAGCAKTGTQAQETRKDDTNTAQTADWQKENPTWLCEEKTTLNVFTFDGVNSNYLPPSNDLKFWQWMEDYTNVHIEWEVAPYASYKDVITAKIGGGEDLADIMMIRFKAIANDAGSNGLLLDLAPFWDTCFTNTSAYFGNLGVDYKGSLATADGSWYCMSMYGHPTDNHIMLIYNTEWMKKLGAEIPSTLDEFTDLVYKMQAAGDLNGNGEADEIVLTAASTSQLESVFNTVFGMKTYNNKTRCQADSDGKVYEEYSTENLKAMLEYLAKLYADGILDAEVTTMDYDILAEKCATDRIGIYCCYGTFAVDYGQLTPKGVNDPTGEYYTLGLPLASEWNNNEPYYIMENSLSGYTGVNAKIDPAKAEIACKWLDVLFADPTALEVRCLGWEGETFNRNADGSIELIPFPDGQVWQPENFGGGQIALPYIQTSDILNLPYTNEPWYLEQAAWIVENCTFYPMSITPVLTMTDEENDLSTMYETDVKSCYEEYRDKFLMGELDIGAKWNEYVDTINKMGLENVVKLYQSIYDRTAK